MQETPPQAYISKVHLKGYKSIRDLEIDFKPGLNIIIGPNGSGKTNFLEVITETLSMESKLLIYDVEYVFNTELGELILKMSNHEIFEDNNIVIISNGNLNINSKTEKLNSSKFLPLKRTDPNKELFWGYGFDLLHIKYGFPEKMPLLSEEGRFTLTLNKEYLKPKNIRTGPIGFSYNEDEFIASIVRHISINASIKKKYDENILSYLEIDDNLISALKNYSPIVDIKFDIEKIIVESSSSEKRYIEELIVYKLDKVYLKFKINNNWLYWNDLSDGTRRIFYIISQFIYVGKQMKIALVEEPELGIHPDQLHKLMDFLAEQAKEKQIIITTHSPQVLNILSPDELDRIIVTRYDGEKGTIMRKLTPEKAQKLGEHIKEGDMFLSERWVHTNLEDDIFNAQDDKNH